MWTSTTWLSLCVLLCWTQLAVQTAEHSSNTREYDNSASIDAHQLNADETLASVSPPRHASSRGKIRAWRRSRLDESESNRKLQEVLDRRVNRNNIVKYHIEKDNDRTKVQAKSGNNISHLKRFKRTIRNVRFDAPMHGHSFERTSRMDQPNFNYPRIHIRPDRSPESFYQYSDEQFSNGQDYSQGNHFRFPRDHFENFDRGEDEFHQISVMPPSQEFHFTPGEENRPGNHFQHTGLPGDNQPFENNLQHTGFPGDNQPFENNLQHTGFPGDNQPFENNGEKVHHEREATIFGDFPGPGHFMRNNYNDYVRPGMLGGAFIGTNSYGGAGPLNNLQKMGLHGRQNFQGLMRPSPQLYGGIQPHYGGALQPQIGYGMQPQLGYGMQPHYGYGMQPHLNGGLPPILQRPMGPIFNPRSAGEPEQLSCPEGQIAMRVEGGNNNKQPDINVEHEDGELRNSNSEQDTPITLKCFDVNGDLARAAEETNQEPMIPNIPHQPQGELPSQSARSKPDNTPIASISLTVPKNAINFVGGQYLKDKDWTKPDAAAEARAASDDTPTADQLEFVDGLWVSKKGKQAQPPCMTEQKGEAMPEDRFEPNARQDNGDGPIVGDNEIESDVRPGTEVNANLPVFSVARPPIPTLARNLQQLTNERLKLLRTVVENIQLNTDLAKRVSDLAARQQANSPTIGDATLGGVPSSANARQDNGDGPIVGDNEIESDVRPGAEVNANLPAFSVARPPIPTLAQNLQQLTNERLKLLRTVVKNIQLNTDLAERVSDLAARQQANSPTIGDATLGGLPTSGSLNGIASNPPFAPVLSSIQDAAANLRTQVTQNLNAGQFRSADPNENTLAGGGMIFPTNTLPIGSPLLRLTGSMLQRQQDAANRMLALTSANAVARPISPQAIPTSRANQEQVINTLGANKDSTQDNFAETMITKVKAGITDAADEVVNAAHDKLESLRNTINNTTVDDVVTNPKAAESLDPVLTGQLSQNKEIVHTLPIIIISEKTVNAVGSTPLQETTKQGEGTLRAHKEASIEDNDIISVETSEHLPKAQVKSSASARDGFRAAEIQTSDSLPNENECQTYIKEIVDKELENHRRNNANSAVFMDDKFREQLMERVNEEVIKHRQRLAQAESTAPPSGRIKQPFSCDDSDMKLEIVRQIIKMLSEWIQPEADAVAGVQG